MFDPMLARLGVRAGERRRVGRLVAVHFAIICSYTLARAARDALFLEKLTAQRLPYLYVAVAICTALAAFGLERSSTRYHFVNLVSRALVGTGISLALFGALFLLYHGPALAIGFYLWTGAYGLILVSLFWALVNEAMDSRQAKRLFGWIGAGGIVGGLVGGGLATLVGGWVGPEATLFLAGAMLVAAAAIVGHAGDTGAQRAVERAFETQSKAPLLADSYVRWIALLALLAGLTASILDYQFKVALQEASDGNPIRTTRFLGYYYILLNTGALVLQLGASGWLLRHAGASSAAALLPTGLALGATVGLLRASGPLFLAGMRLYEAGMRISLAKSAWEFLYFPIPSRLRRRVKTFVEAFVDRASEAIAGLGILALGALGAAGPRDLAIVTFVLSAAWLAVNMRLRGAYVRQLSSSLRSLVVSDERPPAGPPEAQLLEEAHRLLDSPFERRALYAFDLLETMDPEGLATRLGALQDHPVAAIRARALARLADPAHPVASPLLRTLLHDESVEVRSEAVRLYSERFDDSAQQMEKLLNSTEEAERTAAIAYLLAQPGAGSEARIAPRVAALLHDPSPQVRRAVATALGRRPSPSPLHRHLLQLLDDVDVEVRREAIMACGSVRLREFVPALLPHLAPPQNRDATRLALAAYGDRIVGTIGDYLGDDQVPIGLRRQLPSVLAAISTQAAANELLRAPHPTDAHLLLELLKAQNKIRARNPNVLFPRPPVREALQREVELFLSLHVHLEVWRAEAPSRARDLLLGSLEDRLEATLARIFRRLGLLYPSQEIFLGYRAVAGTSRRTRAQALEYLEAVLLPEDRRLLLPLLEEPEKRLALAETFYGLRPLDAASSLESLVHSDDSWLQACALYTIGARRLRNFAALARQALQSAAPLVRETAGWSLRNLETS